MAATYPKTEAKQLVSDLAWEYRENKQKGRPTRMQDYLQKCPDHHARQAFKDLVNSDLLLDLMTGSKMKA